MSNADWNRWRLAAVLIASLSALASSIVHSVASVWPMWHDMIEDCIRVSAVAVIAAGVDFGVTVWRRERA